jgi:YHS domain-containing protein
VRAAVYAVWVVIALVSLLQVFRRSLPGGVSSPPPTTDELVKDPVCQTYIVRSRAVSRETAGGPRYFCSPACAARFAG